MAGIEFTTETRQQAERIGTADIVVGVAGPVAADELRARTERIAEQLGTSLGSMRLVFAWPGPPGDSAAIGPDDGSGVPVFLPFGPAPHTGGEFWTDVSAGQRAVLALAASLNARACIVVGPDMAALRARAIQLFAYAVLERQCGLVMPVYPTGKYDGLINTGILSPLSRALYGKRVRFPLSFDFAASGSMCARLAETAPGNGSAAASLLWPVSIVATQTPQSAIGEVKIDVHHEVATGGLELSAVLAQIVGSQFHEAEVLAPQWQRIRGSQPAPEWGTLAPRDGDATPSDWQPMLDSFLLGSRNLEEVWRLVLPPNTMLDIRRLTRLPPSQFHMPDELWAGVVYDFALAWRLRTLSRVHLLGALTPLYLGWAASYVREVAGMDPTALETRLEQFARVWEEKKPYLLSRWRWPDRFNP